MAHLFRYERPEQSLEFYHEAWWQSSAPPPSDQPPIVTEYFPILPNDALQLETDETDIRLFWVNTPSGDTLGTVHGFLADGKNFTLPYTYIAVEHSNIVVVPTTLLTRYAEYCLVTFYLGKQALLRAPSANFDATDAQRALQYWSEYRRHAA